jgi:nucleotide-binding universal stress UspA family protein
MARQRGFQVVAASDGSATARAAIASAVDFPWPPDSRVRVVVARGRAAASAEWPAAAWAALDPSFDRVAEEARKVLAARWPDAEAQVVDRPPADAILQAARGADAIVLGSRGHSLLGRFLMGSVSRAVVQRARCPVLVVKARQRPFVRFLVGLDGSENARRAVTFLTRLAPPRGGQVTVLRVVEPVRPPSLALMPGGVRATLAREARRLTSERVAPARRDVERAAAELKQAGWSVRPLVRLAAPPLDEVLAASKKAGADCVVLGARGVGGVERLLLGSVALGTLSRARVPVLIVR